jgi:hypothetical protein
MQRLLPHLREPLRNRILAIFETILPPDVLAVPHPPVECKMAGFLPVEQRRGASKNDKVRAAKRMISSAVRNANFALQHAHSSGDRLPRKARELIGTSTIFPGKFPLFSPAVPVTLVRGGPSCAQRSKAGLPSFAHRSKK